MTAPVKPPAPSVGRNRRRFGLDTLLPADPAVIEAGVLRLIGDIAPDAIPVRPASQPDRASPVGHRPVPAFVAGAPDLLLLLPGGRSACLKIRTQAMRLTADQASFGALCEERGIPFAVVRSVEEARAALVRLGVAAREGR